MSLIISRLNLTTDVKTAKPVHIHRIHAIIVRPFPVIKVNILSVNGRNARRILRPLHSALNLERINTRRKQLWQIFQGTHVF